MEIGINTAVRMGFRVIACGDAISTPQGYFLALRTSARHPKTMGLAITASHNPAQYIGIKFTVPTVQAIGLDCGPLGGLTKVREIYHSDETFPAVPGGELFLASNPTAEYVDYSLDAAGVKPGELAGLTVVLDAFHGSAGPELWHALTKAGVRVVPLRLVPNGEFPTGSPNPTSQGKMDRAIQLAAAKKNADVVLGIDGDGDRVVFGDRRGILTAGFVTVPILRTLLARGQALDRREGALRSEGESARARRVGPTRRRAGPLPQRPLADQRLHDTRSARPPAPRNRATTITNCKYQNLKISGENSIVTILLFLKAVKQNPRPDASSSGRCRTRSSPPANSTTNSPTNGPRPGPRRRDRQLRRPTARRPNRPPPTASTSKAPSSTAA